MKSRFLLQTVAAFALLLTAVVYCGRLVGLSGGGELDLGGHSTTSLSAETHRFFANELDRNLAITYLVSSRDDMPSHFKGVEKQVRGLLEARLIQVEHGQVIEAEGRYSMIAGVQHFLAEGQGFQIDGFGLLVAAQILVYARQEIEVRS